MFQMQELCSLLQAVILADTPYVTEKTVVHTVLYNEVALGAFIPHDQIFPNQAADCSLEAAIWALG